MNFMFVLGNILIGLAVGALGGLAGASVLNGSAAHFALHGAMFGVLFGLLFAQRATSLGAGLMWGLSLAFLTWITVAAAAPVSGNMFFGARVHFPELVFSVVCLALPVSLVLGVRVSRRSLAGEHSFSWARAVTAGGFAGILASLIFSRWMYVGDFFPLVAGLELHARSMSVVLQFLMALLIGSTFGLLFQPDVRSFGSSMGWDSAMAFSGGFWVS